MTAPVPTAEEREQALDDLLRGLGSVLVAFSGGVDSAYLAVRARRVLGERSLAVTADSDSLADDQRRMAEDVARRFDLRHRVIHTGELQDPRYLRNAVDRCYYCKTELYRHLVPMAEEAGFAFVADGLIVDDLTDVRPGRRAAAEAGVRSPLAEAGFTKKDVRARSQALGLPTWDRPASPCLSSRIPYGTLVTVGALRRIETAEAALRALGFRELRVRHFGERARVEIAPDELPRLQDVALRAACESAVQAAGYAAVEIDPAGYRRGRLNEPGTH
jgi:pyridinium-3,5-biscarboxylic acid mononucleotide sulfurtransferase